MVLLVCFLGVTSGAYAFRNEPAGFRELPWGTSVSGLEGMEYLRESEEGGAMKIYVKRDEMLSMNGAKLESIEYGFVRGALAQVTLKVKDLLNFVRLREAAFSIFGEGSELLPGTERYYWDGDETRIELISRLEFA